MPNTKLNHTPGPWRMWKDMDPREPWMIVGPSVDTVAQVAMENTQRESNARLISAAPDLLAAAQNLLCHHRIVKPPVMTDTLRERIEMLRAAIAKATGN